MNRSPVLVLGANGRFGRAAVDAFAAAGWHVLAQMRRAPGTPLPANAEAVTQGMDDPAALAARAAGARLVVYAVNPVYTRWEQDLMPLFREGIEVTQRLNANFLVPGNVYNFGEGMPAVLNEGTPQRPSTRKGEQRREMEDELRRLAAQGLNSVLIRAGDFFGCGTGSWLDLAMVKSMRRGKLVYPGPLDLAHAWAYLPDLAAAFVAVAESDIAPGYHDLHFPGHTLTGRQMLAALEQAAGDLGLRPAAGFRHAGMPWAAMRAIGLVNPMLRELVRMSYLWRVPHALAGTALQRLAGPLPATPIVAALRQSLLDLGYAQSALSLAA